MTERAKDQVCAHCGDEIPFEEVVWVDESGDTVAIPDFEKHPADPYHEECVP